MKYPENYTALQTEEMEYISGGSDANVALVGIGFGATSYVRWHRVLIGEPSARN